VLSRRSLRFSRTRVAFSGTATDRGCGARGAGRVRRMWVGVYRAVPGACRWLQPNGRLGPRRSCRSRTLLPARGTTRWSFAKSAALPTGLYGVWALGDDTAGNREHGSSAARRAFFRLR
jgi:hypothetical protein